MSSKGKSQQTKPKTTGGSKDASKSSTAAQSKTTKVKKTTTEVKKSVKAASQSIFKYYVRLDFNSKLL